jgi:HEAT repeat protein
VISTLTALLADPKMGGLNSRKGEDREQAADDLREMGAYAKEASPALRSHLDDEDVYVRLSAAAALLAIHGDERATLAILSDALKHPDEEVRREAAWRLGNAGTTAWAAVAALREACRDHVPRVRIAVVRALAQIDSEDQTVVTMLTSLLDEHAPKLQRRQAVEILGSLGARAKAALPVLQSIRMVEGDDGIPHDAKKALQPIERAMRIESNKFDSR